MNAIPTKNHRRFSYLGFLVAVLFAAQFNQASANTYSYFAATGNWSTAANWSGAIVPLSTDNFTQTTTATILIDGTSASPDAINNVTFDGGTIFIKGLANTTATTWNIAGTLTVEYVSGNNYVIRQNGAGNGMLTVNAGALDVQTGASISLGNSAGGLIINVSGATTLDGNSSSINVDNNLGTGMGGSAAFNGGITFTGSSAVFLNGGATAAQTTAATVASAAFLSSSSTTAKVTGSNTTTNGTQVGTLTINGTAGSTYTFAGILENNYTTGTGNTLAVVMAGTNTQILTGTSNTYTGSTTINGGVLEINGSLGTSFASGGSAVTVGGTGSTGTPTLAGAGNGTTTGIVYGAVTVSNGGTISPGNGSTLGTLTVGSSAFQSGSTLAINLNSGGSSELVIHGAATFAGTDNITFSGTTGATATTGVGQYTLATIGSGSNLTASDFTGTAPTYYHLTNNSGDTALYLTHEATISINTPTTAASSIISGGSTAISFTVANTAPSGSSSLSASAASGTNTSGSITGPITVAAGGTSGTETGISFTDSTTTGANQVGTFTVSDPNADNTPQTGTVSVNVYGHAAPSLSGTTLNLGNIHAGYSGTVTSSNSLTATNGSSGAYIVNLKGSATSASGVTLTSVSGVTAGSSANISATLASGQGPESFSSQTYTFADDSTLSGASSSVATQSITVSGEVYSGTSTWITNGSGSWGTTSGTGTETFGQNWGSNQGSPGLDSSFKGVDTATFGAVGGSPVASSTVYLNAAAPDLNSITFSSPLTSYTLAQQNDSVSANSITLSQGSGASLPSINVTANSSAGTQTISAPIILGANTSVNVGSNQTLILNGAISGSGSGLTYTGAGTTYVTGNNTYTGGTTVNAGTLVVSNSSGSATGTGAFNLASGATLSGTGTINASNATISGTVNVGNGGTTDVLHLTSSGTTNFTNASLTFNLDTVTLGNSSQVALGNTPTVSFGNTSLTLNLTGGNQIFTPTDFILFTSTANTDVFQGLTVNSDNIITSGLTFTLTGSYASKYEVSYLELVSNGVGGVNIVAVVPEPGTWALMLFGLAGLVLIQRYRYR